MIFAVIYKPLEDDETSGPIISCRSVSSMENLVHPRLPKVYFVRVDEQRGNWDVTHEVIKGEVVPKQASVVNDEAQRLAMVQMRVRRDQLLKECDWTQGADAASALSPEKIVAWATYRQALRDLPNDFTGDWPVDPKGNS